ncbi:MAG: hypothetical protein AAB427_02620, partial [Chloroflexota bacterium]
MTLTFVHERLANVGLIYSLAVGAWALYLAFTKRGLTSSFWGALVINELIFIAQGVVGATMWIEGLRPARGVHILYGILSVIVLPSAFAFTKGGATRREAATYGLICLFLAGVALRAATTGGGAP